MGCCGGVDTHPDIDTTAAPLQATQRQIEFKIKQRSLVGKLSTRPSVDDLIGMHIMKP